MYDKINKEGKFHSNLFQPVNRREFIKQSGIAGLIGMTTASRAAGYLNADKKIRIGIVGGGFGSSFQFHEHPDCIVAAVSDLRPERCSKLMKVYRCSKSYPSLEEMVKDKNIDAIGLFTEAPNHVRHTKLIMEHGKHVLCAVPACWATLEEGEDLLHTVKKHGLTYMMAETSYYQQFTLSVRRMYQQGDFGDLFYCESEYQHDGLESLYIENGQKTWRYGVAPMHYPTHCTAHLVGVTGERLTQVSCLGWGDDSPYLQDNVYQNPFHNESAFFKTDRGHAFRVNVWWKGAHLGGERANWIGSKMSFYASNGRSKAALVKKSGVTGVDDAGFAQSKPYLETFEDKQWWATELLPEPLRHNSGHEGSHSFITHEFVDALVHNRKPTVDVLEALAYTVPGIVAHQSALQGGALLKIPQMS